MKTQDFLTVTAALPDLIAQTSRLIPWHRLGSVLEPLVDEIDRALRNQPTDDDVFELEIHQARLRLITDTIKTGTINCVLQSDIAREEQHTRELQHTIRAVDQMAKEAEK